MCITTAPHLRAHRRQCTQHMHSHAFTTPRVHDPIPHTYTRSKAYLTATWCWPSATVAIMLCTPRVHTLRRPPTVSHVAHTRTQYLNTPLAAKRASLPAPRAPTAPALHLCRLHSHTVTAIAPIVLCALHACTQDHAPCAPCPARAFITHMRAPSPRALPLRPPSVTHPTHPSQTCTALHIGHCVTCAMHPARSRIHGHARRPPAHRPAHTTCTLYTL